MRVLLLTLTLFDWETGISVTVAIFAFVGRTLLDLDARILLMGAVTGVCVNISYVMKVMRRVNRSFRVTYTCG